ncbi:hypothetical protein BDF21DRAFT_374116 [Thamnidium elegans]|nr:hypothetical protein BDF21DRAFT_374116 [Thamnidium elegans]
MDIFSITKKSKRKEVGISLTPSLPRQSSIQGEKNSLPPSSNWNYTPRSSSISNDEGHRSSTDTRKTSIDFNGFSEPEVQDLFEKMLTRRGIHDQSARSVMLAFSTEKKWLMVSQDKQADSAAPTPTSSTSSNTNLDHTSTIIAANDKNSPDFYIDKFLEADMKGVTPRLIAHLAVSLRTMPLIWVKQFIESSGLQIITNVIGALNISDQKTEADLQMEVEILKCFKSLINNRWGAREVIAHPQCIYHIVLSLVSPPIQTRKLVCEILAFVCHVDLPKGQEIVLKGLDKLSEHLGEFGRFDAWLKLLDATLDGRGRMGSLVGASEDVKRLIGGGAPDSHLGDFGLSNMMLINSLVTVIEDVEVRVHLRNQMNASGLDTIMEKMLDFNNEQLKRHINIYKQMGENDVDEIMEIYNETILTNMNDPRACFERILERVEGTRSYNFFLSALQHMLMIQAQGDIQVRYFQILDKLITQVVMDRKGIKNEDMSMGWNVGMLIDKFAEQDQINKSAQEAKETKQMLEKVIKEKQELETEISLKGDGLIGTLRDKTSSLEDLLRMSRHTISTLQRKLKDTQQEYEMNVTALDQQLKDILLTASDANKKDGVGQDAQNGHFILGREEVTRAYDRLKAQAILEGKPGENEDDGKIPRAEGLSDTFKSSLQGQLGGGPAGFIIPGTAPLIGSTRRVPVGGGRKNWLDDAAATELAQDGQKGGVKMNIELKDQLNQLLSENGPDPTTTDHSDKPISALAAEIEQKLRQHNSKPDPLKLPAAGGLATANATEYFPRSSSVSSTNKSTTAISGITQGTSPNIDIPLPSLSPSSPQTSNIPISSTSTSSISVSNAIPPPPPPPPPPPHTPASGTATRSVPAPPPAPPLPPVNSTTSRGIPAPPPAPPFPGTAASKTAGGPPPPPPPPPPGGKGCPPPPPPPPPPGAPGAPPPPPGGPAVPTGPPRKVIRHQPNVKTRALQWTKIQANFVGKTVWGSNEIDEIALEDELDVLGVFDSIESLFAQKVIEKKKRMQKEKKQEICILDPKKAYNINITLLSKLKHLSFDQVSRAFLQVDDSIITENLLGNLQVNIPTAEEQGKLSVFVKSASDEDLEQLSKPDTFCCEMMKIDRYKERVDNMLFRATFAEKHQQLSRNMSSVLEASIAIKDSASFKELLKFILVLGNFMNGTTFQGGAFGIRISSINKLVDTKGTEGNTTLLHFLVDSVELKFPRLHGFLDDLQESGNACRVTLQDMVKDYNEIRVGLQKLIQELDNHYDEDEETPEGDNYAQVMRNFRNDAIEKFEELEVRYTSMDVAYKDVVSYYGENADQMKPDEFFGIFKTFTSSWERAMSDNVTAKKKLENMEKVRRADEERKERIKAQRLRGVDTSDANQSGTDDDKNIMDNLLDKLRAGDLDTSVKRTRHERSNTTREKRMQKSESVAILAEDLLKSIQSDDGTGLSLTPSLPRSNRLGASRRNNLPHSGSSKTLLEEISMS